MSELKKNLLWGLTGLVLAILIFYGGMKYKESKILNSPTVIVVDTTSHIANLSLKDTTISPAVIYKPNPDRKKYIDSLIVERTLRDSLINFIMEKVSLFGATFTDTNTVKDSTGTLTHIESFNIMADPLYASIHRTDLVNKINWQSYDTTKTKYVMVEPTLWDRIKDSALLSSVITFLYFIVRSL